MSNKSLPLYVALDVDSEEKALYLARQVSAYVEGFKVGPRLFFKTDKSFLLKLKTYGKVFLDFKFFDIPSAMEGAVMSAFNIGADMVTVHASAGLKALKNLAVLEKKINASRNTSFRILAVTVLTSFSQKSLPYFAKPFSILSQVESLSDLVIKSGLRGMVCSGAEVASIKKRHPEAYLLVPGVRFQTGESNDQKRVFTPKDVLKNGACAFVMGRPIYQAHNPVDVCKKLLLYKRSYHE